MRPRTAWAPVLWPGGELPGQAAAVLRAAGDRADDRARGRPVHAHRRAARPARPTPASPPARAPRSVSTRRRRRGAAPALREVASDRRLQAALAAGSGVEARPRRLVGGAREIVLIELYSQEEELIARAGSPAGVAPRGAPIAAGGQTLGTLAVSVTAADALATRVRTLTGLDAAVYRDGRLLAATTGRAPRTAAGSADSAIPTTSRSEAAEYRARVESIPEPAGPPVELALLQDTAALSDTISENRLVIGGLLLAFLLLAMLARGGCQPRAHGPDRHVPGRRAAPRARGLRPPGSGRPATTSSPSWGTSSTACRRSSRRRSRRSSASARSWRRPIRRVGDALATGLDRDGVVALAVRQAVDACGAEAGRALPLERGAFHEHRSGRDDADPARRDRRCRAAGVRAERRGGARAARPDRPRGGPAPPAPGERGPGRRRPRAGGSDAGTGRVGGAGVPGRPLDRAARPRPSRARRRSCSSTWRARRSCRSRTRACTQTVERQAVTDELTGLANARAFRSILDREIERSRRFQSPLGLVMARPRRLQAGQRPPRPPAGRRGARLGRGRAAGPLARHRRPGPLRRRGAGGGAAPDRRRGGRPARRAHARGGRAAARAARGRARIASGHGQLRRGVGAGERGRPGEAGRRRRRRPLQGQARRQEPGGARANGWRRPAERRRGGPKASGEPR